MFSVLEPLLDPLNMKLYTEQKERNFETKISFSFSFTYGIMLDTYIDMRTRCFSVNADYIHEGDYETNVDFKFYDEHVLVLINKGTRLVDLFNVDYEITEEELFQESTVTDFYGLDMEMMQKLKQIHDFYMRHL